ncbi:MAG: acetate--CoA ligase family protein [Anaerolineaceae bacterium]|nr:acetate--CoA ligase family protein [Anaerolineaceae bacterium]
MTSSLSPFFNAAGVAVIGASSNPQKLSYGILKNLIHSTYQGEVYPVNPGSKEILGRRCYAHISEVPDPVELAVLVVPAPVTPQTLEDCGKRGIKAAIIISGGFKEVGESGTDLEKECLEIARRYGMRLIGPNCVGTMCMRTGLNTTFIYGVPDTGGIGFLSQSGAVCGGVIDMVLGKKIGFSHFISMGNEADVTETDLIEYLGEDPSTRVIAAYVEQIRDGRRFLEVARKVSRVKPIVLLKAGRSGAGARAVSSHTGSLAGSYTAYQTAFKQAGVIEVQNWSELFDVAIAFDFQPIPAGRRAVIITNAGGPAAITSDALANNGLLLEDLEEATKVELRKHLNPAAQVSNPVDMLGGVDGPMYGMAVSTLMKDKNVDIILPILVPHALTNSVEVAQAIIDASKTGSKPVLPVFMGDQSVAEARITLQGNRLPMYVYPETPALVLRNMLTYAEWRSQQTEGVHVLHDIRVEPVQKILDDAQKAGSLGEAQTRPLLEAYGIPVVRGGFAASAAEAAHLFDEIGGPVVMKIVSPEILHKSDVGGIRLNLADRSAVLAEYDRLMNDIRRAKPDARLEGVLIEKMAPRGQEVIIGMKRDAGFGPMLMFGLGGIYVELFKDVAFRIAPVSAVEAHQMIAETRAGKLLTGFRGSAKADLNAVVDVIQRLGRISLDFPQIEEIEVNPLLVYPEGQGALALDGRVILKK